MYEVHAQRRLKTKVYLKHVQWKFVQKQNSQILISKDDRKLVFNAKSYDLRTFNAISCLRCALIQILLFASYFIPLTS